MCIVLNETTYIFPFALFRFTSVPLDRGSKLHLEIIRHDDF